jgi:hypothetical protein
MSRTEFSPEMLRLFLRARCLHGVTSGIDRDVRAAKVRLRKAAGVTSAVFDMAFSGRLRSAAPRLRLWGACGLVPADRGITLTDDGGQEHDRFAEQ